MHDRGVGEGLDGKIAVVTGAARGMGAAIARTLADRGAFVAACDIDEEAVGRAATSILDAGGAAQPYTLDVSMQDAVRDAIDRIVDERGGVHILVNNAGILYPTGFDRITDEEWRRTLAVNLTGPFYLCQACFGPMKRAGFGRIVNMSSSAGRSTSDLGGAHYTVSKAGLLGLTRHLAKEGGPEITVNAVCPGIIDTEMAAKHSTKEQLAGILDHLPLRRIGTPQDVANLVAFLVSDDAAYITGESIEIDGGELMI
jgi:NAD(P)-dependent dehydrogenase (short-subunit alcohol dehydrogenase family)